METESRGEPLRSIGLTVSIALVLLLGMLGIGWLATRDREVVPLPNRRAPELSATLSIVPIWIISRLLATEPAR